MYQSQDNNVIYYIKKSTFNITYNLINYYFYLKIFYTF